MQFTVDLTGLNPAVAQGIIKGLHHEDRARHALGLVRQRRMAQLLAHNPHAMTGRGELRQNMILDETQWQAFMQVYGQKCWADPDFGKWVLKQDQHADLRVKDTGTRIQSGWTPPSHHTGKGDSRG